jgi:hypothetical protein
LKKLDIQNQYVDYKSQPPQLKMDFTMAPEEVDEAKEKLTKYFNFVKQTMTMRNQKGNQGAQIQNQQLQSQMQAQLLQRPQPNQQQMQQAQAQAMQQSQSQQAQAAAKAQATHQLSTANLQQNNQAYQEARNSNPQGPKPMHQAPRGSQPPAAPTTEKAPQFPMGASPQGVPIAFNSARPPLTQEGLKLPTSKKRKPTLPGTDSPAKATPGSSGSPQTSKAASPEMKKQQQSEQKSSKGADIKGTVRCPQPGCEGRAFRTIPELNKHTDEMHAPVPQAPTQLPSPSPVIGDPLQWLQESMIIGLGLNADGSLPVNPADEAKIPKAGATPSTATMAASTPVNRAQGGTGKAGSPAMLKTPQISNIKTPNSTGKGASVSGAKGVKQEAAPTPNSHDTVMEGSNSNTWPSWTTSTGVTSQSIAEAFKGIEMNQSLFSLDAGILSPPEDDDTTPESTASKESDNSDILDTDKLTIKINAQSGEDQEVDELNEAWNPFGLFDNHPNFGGFGANPTAPVQNWDDGMEIEKDDMESEWEKSFGVGASTEWTTGPIVGWEKFFSVKGD